jgi:hypothetical protein
MTKIEEQALVVARAWRHYIAIDRRLAEGRGASRVDDPRRLSGEREQDARDVRPACAAYKKELDILAQMVL